MARSPAGTPTHRVLSVMHGNVFGGAHNQVIRLDAGLRAAGFTTIAVVPPDAEAAAQRLEANDVEVVRVSLSSFRASPDPRTNARTIRAFRHELQSLKRLISDRGIDLVQAHGVINPHAGLAARRAGVALVWQLLDTRAPVALRRAVMPVVARTADSITSWGRALAATHPGALSLGERCVVVYPPVDPHLRPDPALAEDARTQLGIEAGEIAVGTVGVRNSQKGHEYFVRAAAIAAGANRQATFRVIGAPSPGHAKHMAMVEREADELGLTRDRRITFVDPGSAAPRLVQGLDVFVLSSVPKSEGMPTAILEAMACGKPVVATDVGAVRELVDDGTTGIIVPANQPHELADAITALVSDPELRKRMGEAGRRRAAEDFPLDGLVARHASAYRAALEHRAERHR